MKISGCVITFNEESCIEACLRSLAVCDELLVIDSHSTDRTRELATRAGARVIERAWPGYRSQKQFAIDAASHDWILLVDADEILSPALAREIAQLRQSGPGSLAAFSTPRRLIYFGRTLRHGDAARERRPRLFDRRRASFGTREIHERLEIRGTIGRLRGTLLHDSYRDLADQRTKLAHYARLMGDTLHAEGRRASWLQVTLNPAWRFLRAYILRLGMLDGWRGLMVAALDADYVRRKYLHLRANRRAGD